MENTKIVASNLLVLVVLCVGAFDPFGQPWQGYASNLFNVYVALILISESILIYSVVYGKLTDFSQVAQKRLELIKPVRWFADTGRTALVVISFMVGWYWSGSVLLLWVLLYYSMITHAQETLLERLTRKS